MATGGDLVRVADGEAAALGAGDTVGGAKLRVLETEVEPETDCGDRVGESEPLVEAAPDRDADAGEDRDVEAEGLVPPLHRPKPAGMRRVGWGGEGRRRYWVPLRDEGGGGCNSLALLLGGKFRMTSSHSYSVIAGLCRQGPDRPARPSSCHLTLSNDNKPVRVPPGELLVSELGW